MDDNEIRNKNRERFVSNLEIFAEQMYGDDVNVEVGIFRNADGEVVAKTPRELFIWFGRLKYEFFEIKEDLSLLDPEWTHRERLEKFYEYCRRMEEELDIENVPEEIDDLYFGTGSGTLTYQQRVELLMKMFRVNDYLRYELQYKTEMNDGLRQLLLEQEVLFEKDNDEQREVELKGEIENQGEGK